MLKVAPSKSQDKQLVPLYVVLNHVESRRIWEILQNYCKHGCMCRNLGNSCKNWSNLMFMFIFICLVLTTFQKLIFVWSSRGYEYSYVWSVDPCLSAVLRHFYPFTRIMQICNAYTGETVKYPETLLWNWQLFNNALGHFLANTLYSLFIIYITNWTIVISYDIKTVLFCFPQM